MSQLVFIDRPSPNYDDRTRPIDLIILHYTGMETGAIALDRLCDPEPHAGAYAFPWEKPEDPSVVLGRVSAHYVVDEDGRLWRLVDEVHRAWHAGAGEWAGESDLNARSIGIEIVNGGHDFGLPPYADAQIEALVGLLQDITARWGLRPHQIVGHSDVAPNRKADPGERFPWARLAEAGLTIWPSHTRPHDGGPFLRRGDEGEKVGDLQDQLSAFGYGLKRTAAFDEDTEHVVKAFQRRFRPRRIDGVADDETRALLADVLEQLAKAVTA